MSDPRDDLAALIRDTIRARYVNDNSPEDVAYINDDDPSDAVMVDGFVDFQAVADAVLAAGYRKSASQLASEEITRWESQPCLTCGTTPTLGGFCEAHQ